MRDAYDQYLIDVGMVQEAQYHLIDKFVSLANKQASETWRDVVERLFPGYGSEMYDAQTSRSIDHLPADYPEVLLRAVKAAVELDWTPAPRAKQ